MRRATILTVFVILMCGCSGIPSTHTYEDSTGQHDACYDAWDGPRGCWDDEQGQTHCDPHDPPPGEYEEGPPCEEKEGDAEAWPYVD